MASLSVKYIKELQKHDFIKFIKKYYVKIYLSSPELQKFPLKTYVGVIDRLQRGTQPLYSNERKMLLKRNYKFQNIMLILLNMYTKSHPYKTTRIH